MSKVDTHIGAYDSTHGAVAGAGRANQKRALTIRFLCIGFVGVLLISVFMSLGGYLRLQANENSTLAQRVNSQIMLTQRSLSNQKNQQSSNGNALPMAEALGALAFKQIVNAKGVKLIQKDGTELWQRGRQTELRVNTFMVYHGKGLGLTALEPYKTVDPNVLSETLWQPIVTGQYQPSVFANLLSIGGEERILLVSVDNQRSLKAQRKVAARLFWFLLISSSLLFGALYITFLRGIKTIEDQDEELNEQIVRLSKLLNENKDMQNNIRTASARAVELNEQFLRRVGADLHDGPAQMIGFSIMRLNQALEKDQKEKVHSDSRSKGTGNDAGLVRNESHAIKQALEEALDEIRGISSGLVLPQLEDMTLEQCMKKVVLLHKANSSIQVKEYYQKIKRDIALPIKICAYRFVQEGLNNAHKHGGAEKCRLSLNVHNDVLHISLKDNGIGFRKSKWNQAGSDNLGLIGLRDRVESLGGKLSINSELGVGTALKLSIDLKGG